jgi:uncharacterized protein (DUF433 family)
MSDARLLDAPRDRKPHPMTSEGGPPLCPRAETEGSRIIAPKRAAGRLPARLFEEVSDEEILVQGSRVPLECLLYEHRSGATAQELVRAYPAVPLARVYAILAYCLEHPADIDAYVARAEAYRARSRTHRAANPSPLLGRLGRDPSSPHGDSTRT